MLTLQELTHYLDQLQRYREHIKQSDRELAEIKHALFGFLGINKEEEKIEEQLQRTSFPKMTVTKEQMKAWEKAGMPNPKDFFKGKTNG